MKPTQLTPIYLLLALSSLVLGLSMLLMGEHRHINLVADFYHLTDVATLPVLNILAASSFLLIAMLALINIKQAKFESVLAVLLVVVGLVPVIALAGDNMWINSLGGFPAIGSGQGVIKYFALISIGLLMLAPQLPLLVKKLIAAFPVILVLLWIGGMKFTELEAKGIEGLISHSFLMAWMYSIWDVQTTSNLIGVYDLIAMVLVLGSVFNHKFFVPGALMSGAVFVVTQTFFFTTPDVFSADTLVTTTGHFLIKDLWFIANLLCLGYLQERK